MPYNLRKRSRDVVDSIDYDVPSNKRKLLEELDLDQLDLGPSAYTNNKIDLSEVQIMGYKVFKNVIDVPENVINYMKKQVDTKGAPIFNHNENNKRTDNKRLQCNLAFHQEYMKDFMGKIEMFITKNISTKLTPNNWVVLKSLTGCKNQASHSDYVPDEEFIDALSTESEDMIPLLVIISLMSNTKLHVWEKSVKLITFPENKLTEINPINCKVVSLDKGDVLVFRADLIHAGSDYAEENVRLHVYLDSPVIHRAPNKTWIVHKDGNEELTRIIIPYK
jgi:hypothetical protein